MSHVLTEATAPNGLTNAEIRDLIRGWLAGRPVPKKVLILPPDITRANSHAGPIVQMLVELLPHTEIEVMPALGTHIAMTPEEMDRMYPGVPHRLFRVHDWRGGVTKLGEVPGDFVAKVTDGLDNKPIPVEINRRLLYKSYDLIFSVGQVVPHEVVGMANYNKNIFVGCGGSAMINASHYLGAVYGMERMIGRDLTPIHQIFDYAEEHFCRDIPLVYILTVTAANAGGPNVRSVAMGRGRAMFAESVQISQRHNLNFLDQPVKKVVAYLDPEEFHTTWLGNKSIYRSRMAIADGGELLVIAPGVHRFGEDPENDRLIRKYGYVGREKVMRMAAEHEDLAHNLSVAAHLMHGSSEGRFGITYAPGHLTEAEVKGVGYKYLPLAEALAKYDVKTLRQGMNVVNGEEVYFIANPALGLWADRQRFEEAGKK